MTTTNFSHKTRRALVPMRKAMIDALLLTVFIAWILIVTGLLFSYPWLSVVIYALAYLFTVVLRLRQAARETGEPRNPYNYLFH